MELSDGQKYAIVFLGSLAVAGIVLSTLVFPFWNFIREDVTEEVEFLGLQMEIAMLIRLIKFRKPSRTVI